MTHLSGNLDVTSEAGRIERLKGIGLMLAALGCFACLDTTAKLLSAHMDTVQVVWARYFFHFILAFVVLNPWTRPGLLNSRRLGLQVGRALLLLVNTILNFLALMYLQLDETSSIMFATPFVVAIIAGPILGEWVGPKRLAAIMVGFLGVLVVTRPGLGGLHPAAIFSVLGCLAYAAYIVSTRVLARYDSTATTLFYSSFIGVTATTPIVPFFWTQPSASDWALMATMGGLGAVGHYFLIAAHRLAPAAVLSPFIYAQLAAMITLGYLVFGDTPGLWTLAGAAIVIGSGLYLLTRERHVKPIPSAADPIVEHAPSDDPASQERTAS